MRSVGARRPASERAKPLSDVPTARFFLRGLATGQWDDHSGVLLEEMDQAALVEWLIRQRLAPLAYSRCRDAFPELASRLEDIYFSAVARNTLRFHELSQILDRFRVANIPVVLLKGAALAEGTYDGFAHRTMGDVDLWLRDADMLEAVAIMQELGFQMGAKDNRPLALRLLSLGETQFYGWGLVELHWSPFSGWWLRRTAATDHDEMWERTEPLSIDGLRKDQAGLVRQLAAEDMVIQLAVHLAVNHQFGMCPVRGLMDVALTARARAVDWAIVTERAKRWRVRTAVWVVLNLAECLIGLPGVDGALARLRPSAVRRALLRPLVSPKTALAGRDLRRSRARHLVLVLLVDRPRDVNHLVFRTLWPEPEWLEARYGAQGNRWRHMWGVVRHGRF
jgi:hypothetical protein